MQNYVRPPWVVLTKIQTREDTDAIAFRFFGYKHGEVPGAATTERYDASQFVHRMGIDLLKEYKGYFMEVGVADAPDGPCTPASERIPIHPVLVFRRSNSGQYIGHGLDFPRGFLNRARDRAWISVDDYEGRLDDDYFKQLSEESDRIQEAAASASASKAVPRKEPAIVPVKGQLPKETEEEVQARLRKMKF